jgi:hypothetical protein
MVTVQGPDVWADDPGPEDIQRAFAEEQQARTAAFKSAVAPRLVSVYGTPNEPERELSAWDVRNMLADILETMSNVLSCLQAQAATDDEAALWGNYRQTLYRHTRRINDAPPY